MKVEKDLKYYIFIFIEIIQFLANLYKTNMFKIMGKHFYFKIMYVWDKYT